jgi:hypothetical protein
MIYRLALVVATILTFRRTLLSRAEPHGRVQHEFDGFDLESFVDIGNDDSGHLESGMGSKSAESTSTAPRSENSYKLERDNWNRRDSGYDLTMKSNRGATSSADVNKVLQRHSFLRLGRHMRPFLISS